MEGWTDGYLRGRLDFSVPTELGVTVQSILSHREIKMLVIIIG